MAALANARALHRIHAVRPEWRAVRPARDAVALPERTLLHAGPPFVDACRPSAPILSSAVLCCLYEGWARDEAQAQRLIAHGEVRLQSAQSHGVLAPLAAVISPRASLVEVADATMPSRRAWSLLGSGAGPQIRFGSRDHAVLQRLRWRDQTLAPAVEAALRRGAIDLLPLARTGLDGGDDLHARTTAASAALRTILSARLRGLDGHDATLDAATIEAVDAMLAQTPLFFLTLWMAACALMLSAAAVDGDTHEDQARGESAATLVIALAGNGQQVGIRVAGAPTRWITTDALPPAGPRLAAQSEVLAAPLTGDSGAIDAAGFGAPALATAAEPMAALGPYLGADWQARQCSVRTGAHPGFASLPGVLDAARVARTGVAPVAAIAMIGADGRAGLLGRGIYTAPPALFERALAGRVQGADAVERTP